MAKAFSKDPARRYASCIELMDALEEVFSSLPVADEVRAGAVEDSRWPRPKRAPTRSACAQAVRAVAADRGGGRSGCSRSWAALIFLSASPRASGNRKRAVYRGAGASYSGAPKVSPPPAVKERNTRASRARGEGRCRGACEGAAGSVRHHAAGSAGHRRQQAGVRRANRPARWN